MSEFLDQLEHNFSAGQTVPASMWNSLVECLNAQLQGSLLALGSGVVEGGEVSAGAGLSVSLTPIMDIVPSTKGNVFVWTQGEAGSVASLPANSTVYIWAYAVFQTDPGDPDSRESAVVVLDWSYNDSDEANAVLHAKVVTGTDSVTSVTDLRSFIPSRQSETLAAQIATLEAAVGIPYGGSATIGDRLTALEAGGAGGNTVYWGALIRALGDTTTIPEFVDAEAAAAVAAHVAAYHGGGTSDAPAPEPWDGQAVDEGRGVLLLTRQNNWQLVGALPNTAGVVFGVAGDGTNGTTDLTA